jgi:hypothetical protein
LWYNQKIWDKNMAIMDNVLKMTNLSFSRGRTRPDAKIHAPQGVFVTPSSRRSESGVALVIVLVLAAVSLTLITALLYLITVGAQTSGAQKRYRTALEAGLAGSDIVKQVIAVRGDNTAIGTFLGNLTGLNAAQNATLSACTGTAYSSGTGLTVTGAAAKLMTSTPTWGTTCGYTDFSAGPADPAHPLGNYDFTFQLGTSPSFNVYVKIVDAREGNTGSTGGHTLVRKGVVANIGGGGEISSQSIPYLYTFEVDCENTASPSERAKFSVLYQF